MFGKKNKNQKIVGDRRSWRNAGCEDDNTGFRY